MTTKTQTYAMYEGGERVGEQKATTPNRALTEYFGDRLASSRSRYGTLTTGTHVAAMLVHGGRAYYGRGAMNPNTGRREAV